MWRETQEQAWLPNSRTETSNISSSDSADPAAPSVSTASACQLWTLEPEHTHTLVQYLFRLSTALCEHGWHADSQIWMSQYPHKDSEDWVLFLLPHWVNLQWRWALCWKGVSDYLLVTRSCTAAPYAVYSQWLQSIIWERLNLKPQKLGVLLFLYVT